MSRPLPQSLARFAGVRVPVLDHGFIELLDVMGDDEAVVEGARVSVEGDGVQAVSDNRGLIRYLLRARHTTPFEMAEVKIRVKLPIVVERQWVRHRAASTNEQSARYGILADEFYVPPADQVCYQATDNKQGRAGVVPEEVSSWFRDRLLADGQHVFDGYQLAIDQDIARETARFGLPLGTYTMKIWKIDLHNLLHFSSLRLDGHAQWEIRQYAGVIADILREWVPLSWEAFEDYRLHAHTFSRQEMEILREIARVWLVEQERRVRVGTTEELERMSRLGAARTELQPQFEAAGLSTRERAAFLRALGLLS